MDNPAHPGPGPSMDSPLPLDGATRPPRRQRGQAVIYVYLFLAVLVISASFLYKAGKLTSDKMQVQNAADAAAYSAMVIEARDLNFAAYMNRAIVANEVAIGQLVGLASWAYHWRSFGDFLMAYDTLFIGPATLGVSTPIMQSLTKFAFTLPGKAFITVLKALADYGTTTLHNANKMYGWAQYAYHITSLLNVAGVFDGVIRQNGPTGAKLSDYGLFNLIVHMASYGALPALPGERFSEGYLPTKKAPVADYQAGTTPYARLAGLIRESRDPFTKARGWELRPPGFPLDLTVRQDWTVNPKVLGVHVGRTGIVWEIRFHFDISLERKGGSELRLVIPFNGKGDLTGANFNWSSADATSMMFELSGGFDLWAYLLGAMLGHIGANVSVQNDRFIITYKIGPFSGSIPPGGMYFPTNYPFGAGFYQAGIKGSKKTEKANLEYKQMLLAALGGGPIEREHYGQAAEHSLAWMSPGVEGVPFPPLGVAASTLPPSDPKHRIKDKFGPFNSYGGLPSFVGVTGTEQTYDGYGAPFLIVGVVQDEGDYDKGASGQPEREPAGRFTLTERLADREIAAIAKGELHFKRPTDIKAKYFWRADGDTELGNTFNPYWQARLVETSYADRVLALLIQQKQDFAQLGTSLQLFFNGLASCFSGFVP
ncbi:MAG: hypothetical protein D6786_05065 [Gammaproteobacteria bacterium]|nr:MAG: hypothetical protein D6786_05065 [Gammaproteobacteria bacterium]